MFGRTLDRDDPRLDHPFREPGAPDAQDSLAAARSLLAPGPLTSIRRNWHLILVPPFATALAVFFLTASILVSRRALRLVDPMLCAAASLDGCLREIASTMAGIKIPNEGWVGAVFPGLVILNSIGIIAMNAAVIRYFVKAVPTWLQTLAEASPARYLGRITNALLDPSRSVSYNRTVHLSIGCCLLAFGAWGLLLSGTGPWAALVRDVPGFDPAASRAKVWHATPVILSSYVAFVCFRQAAIQFLDLRRLETGSRSARLATWNARLHPLDEGIAHIAHWSDLHITESDDVGRIDGGPSGNRALRRIVSDQLTVLQSVDAIVITGDITDAGLAAEWRAFFGIVPAELLTKMIVVPGNHDTNIVWGSDLTAIESPTRHGFYLRQLRMLAAIDKIQGKRAWVLGHPRPITVRQLLGRSSAELNDFASRLSDWMFSPAGIWRSAFPMLVDIPNTNLAVVVLDSVAFSAGILSNAFGRVSDDQLRDLKKVAECLPQKNLIVALHHHVALPLALAPGGIKRIQEAFLLLQNPRATLAAIRSIKPCAILHGHRHVEYAGRLGDLEIFSAPSTTLGDDSGRLVRPGFWVLKVGGPKDRTEVISRFFHETGDSA